MSIPALALALLAAPGPRQAPLPASTSVDATPLAESPRTAPPEEPALPRATLSEVRDHPSRWLGEVFVATVQFDAPRHAPTFLSRFAPSTYWAFGAWGDEQPLWERADYEAPAQRLFARRGTAPEIFLRAARRYERFEVEAVVREVLLGEPWIEVRRVRRLQGSWNEGALVHATRAAALAHSGRWLLAAEQYDRALAGRLPARARTEMESLRDDCRARHARREEIRRRGNASFGLMR